MPNLSIERGKDPMREVEQAVIRMILLLTRGSADALPGTSAANATKLHPH